ncbi:tryptophan synthase beta subunit-like PLP-dependent enzyme [Sphaerosporella brunnea]|uniref:L-serine ammonia-lyase n=1 Tax=Sphaerosporella brunnea TaxID=1250544 RepID=A0A5J5EDF6_9PEZI|nr:tryptophan synthase beta subunit-like PLP-dependent enzyme [Sphaerosporella brunnea]
MTVTEIQPALPWIHTPLLESKALSEVAGCRVFMKMDMFQPSGSFKSRGVGNEILKFILSRPSDSPATHVYCSSGGNAGLAAVFASKALGALCTVVVPSSTTAFMKSKLLAAGATEVITHGASFVDADMHTRTLVASDVNGFYCAPFDHEDVWDANSTLIDEILEDIPGGEAPEAIVASVGGGGLFIGIQLGLERHGLEKKVKVVAVETEGAESLNAALRARELVTLPAITSIATSLGARTVAKKAFEVGQYPNVISKVVSDGMAARSCIKMAEDERVLVEAACGASLAAVYEVGLKKTIPELTSNSKVVVIVCGGSNINLDMLAHYKQEYGIQQK